MKRKKASCSYKKNYCKEQVDVCKPGCDSKKYAKQGNGCYDKKDSCIKKDICEPKACGCDNDKYEVTCVDKCVKLAMQAEELFEKAVVCECKAKETYEEAKKLDKSSKALSAKAEDLLDKANSSNKESKMLGYKAQELMDKSQKLCEQANCLYKEAEEVEQEAKCNCEKAKCLYEKAYAQNDNAKDLYNCAMKADEKALECYNKVGEKIKEYEMKSKKCEDMIKKCSFKMNECDNGMCEPQCNTCGYSEPTYQPPCEQPQEESIIYIDKGCSTYVTPMYDMSDMYYTGDFMHHYPDMENKYMDLDMNCGEDMDEMWMNYYMMMQQMMQNMMNPRNEE